MPEISDRLAAALRHHQAGNTSEAESIYREILSGDPDNFLAWHLLGTLALQSKQPALAIERLHRALAINPNFVEAHNNLGVVLRSQGQLDQAIACYQKVVQLAPDHAEAHFNMGNALKESGRLDKAITCYRHALALRPDYIDALGNLGCVLRDQGHLAEALALHERAAALAPLNAQAQFLLGSDLHESGQFEPARNCYCRALELRPDYAEAHLNHSAISLISGDFSSGWPEYEWRWKTDQLTARDFSQPLWNGESLSGKPILIGAEQGAGDTIQFIRYASLVKARGGNVLVECSPRLTNLLASCPGIDQLITEGQPPPSFDTHAPLLSLPRIFNTTLTDIPARVPYLFANRALVNQWRSALADRPGFRIGINWQGRPGPPEFLKRDIPLAHFAPLAKLPGVRLIALQKNVEQERSSAPPQICDELKQPPLPFDLIDLGDDFDTTTGAFMDTAAIMMNLDLVLTSDTSIAHLAGALGVPVWLALPYVPDWRWLLHRSDSPWYPTMRLFRQPTPGDWSGVFAEIQQQLRQLILNRDRGR